MAASRYATAPIKKTLATIFTTLICILNLAADERILVPANINTQPVRLALDTGVSHTFLFRATAERLGLSIQEPDPNASAPPGGVKAARARCQLSVGSLGRTTEVRVVDSALRMDIDGALAWTDFRTNILHILADTREAIFLDKLPEQALQWPHWNLRPLSQNDLSSRWLGLEIPRTNGRSGVLFIDTGSDEGLRLAPSQFSEWTNKNPGAPGTLYAGYFPALQEGLVVGEEYWANDFELAEDLRFIGMPIRRSPLSEALAVTGYEATLCLFALTRLDVIVDGAAGRVYIQTRHDPKTRYNYNRIGAVFTPRQVTGGDLLARVLKGTPAYEAGVRDGDILLKIGDLDATQWQTDPRIRPMSRFWEQPSGTKVCLECKRGESLVNAAIELKELFPKAAAPRETSKY
jgi:hypothetical protein